MSDVELNRKYQRVRNTDLWPTDLDLDPEYVSPLFIDNLLQRSLAMLCGLSVNGQKVLGATTDGSLKVATTGSGYESYDTDAGTAADAYAAGQQLTIAAGASQWSILVETHEAIIRFRNAGDTAWLNDIPLTKGWHVFDISTTAVQIKNRSAGSNATFTMIGWF